MFIFALLLLASFVSAADVPETNIIYFYSPNCVHCAVVAESGILEEINEWENVTVTKYEVTLSQKGRDLFEYYGNGFGLDRRGYPFLVIEQGEEKFYLMGDTPIVDRLEDNVINFESIPFNENSGSGKQLTLIAVIVAALIDSVNPCAFGVLIFLMLSLLNMGSSKRALRAGLVYTFVVFVVYFFSGLGIFRVIQSFTAATYYIYIAAGILVLGLGLWQFKDVFLPKVGPTLQISPKVKPLIEKIIHKGTIPAMIFLGIVVSLFELPCTGGIYLGILTLMSINKTFAFSYLILYNIIFVLPLLILTFLIYKGMSPKILQNWTSKERKWMKLGAGLVLVSLGVYILLM